MWRQELRVGIVEGWFLSMRTLGGRGDRIGLGGV